jgi:AhpD family alkylhydroperoxidase
MAGAFHKRIFTPEIFFGDLRYLGSRLPRIPAATRNPQVDRAFVEKIMTVTTAVNDCAYCSWFHARIAVESGIREAEVIDLLDLEFEANADPDEVVALLYAQHFAETDRDPDPAMTARLYDHYGRQTGDDIILFIRMISFGNLLGNTWDAVLSRLQGRPAPNSSLGFEILFFLLTFPFMLPAMVLMKLRPNRLSRNGATQGSTAR